MIILFYIVTAVLVLLSFFAGKLYENFICINAPENKSMYQNNLLKEWEKENLMAGRKLDSYFINNGYKKIVIYGVMGQYYEKFRYSIREERFDKIYLMDGQRRGNPKKFSGAYLSEGRSGLPCLRCHRRYFRISLYGDMQGIEKRAGSQKYSGLCRLSLSCV